jgi:tRNA(fMet)-specific endonuclease VapC
MTDRYGQLRAHLADEGTPIGPLDLFIAATALSCGVPLVTNNTREFQRAPDLELEDWTIA